MTIENSNVCKFLSDDERKQYKSYKRTLFWKNFGFWAIVLLVTLGGMPIILAIGGNSDDGNDWGRVAWMWVFFLVCGGLALLFSRNTKKLARFCAQMEGKAEAREARKLGVR